MKRLYLLLLVVVAAVPLFSQNTLTIHQKDGQQFSFGFEDKPVVSFTDSDLIVKSTKTELTYALSSVSKFTFDDIEDAVISINDDAAKAVITLDSYTVSITGAKADIEVRLNSSDGKLLQSYKTDEDGDVTFSIADLPNGTYIISSQSLTVKILKK